MNDTGGGVTAIHDVPGDITRIGFHWMLFFPFCHSKGASICSSHGMSRRSRIFFVPNFRIFEFFSSHGRSRNNLFYHELSNIFHTDCRGGHGFSFITRLVLGPTDQREVIVEFLSITRSVADGCGACSSCEWGGYSSLSIGQYGESVSDDHRSGWNCCLASPEYDASPFMSSPLIILPLMAGSPEAHSSLYSSISMMLIVGS